MSIQFVGVWTRSDRKTGYVTPDRYVCPNCEYDSDDFKLIRPRDVVVDVQTHLCISRNDDHGFSGWSRHDP